MERRHVALTFTLSTFQRCVTVLGLVGCGGATLEADTVLLQVGFAFFEWFASKPPAFLELMGFLMNGALFTYVNVAF